ncbi:NlpC/P60 family protein [Actinomadura sp. NBRC 104412]|uniref:C40 family peptidase n=1 Tax=Actinomadura sp. NBRC 104412 TaxID=3032203 RepID=UPI0025574403|nr:NlpC/P60 family protein [Actinomadura sp. NBRC 104412]
MRAAAVLMLGGALAALAAPGDVRADPAPSARDVERGKERVRRQAAEVGRTKARLAQARGELERLSAGSALAVERYHGEVVRLVRARAAYQAVQARLAEAGRRVEAAKAELAVFAAAAYRTGGGNAWPAVVAGHGGPQGFMDRAAMAEMLARQRAGALQKVQAAVYVAEVFHRQARAAYDEQRTATQRAEAAKRSAEAAVARQNEAVRRLKSRKGVLEKRLGIARAKAAELERARENALKQVPVSIPVSKGPVTNSPSSKGPVTKGTAPGRTLSASRRGAIVARAALRWLGTPYSWGGGNANGPTYGIAHGSRIHGFDCSGLALYAWDKAGVRLDHWTGTQWTSGPRVPLRRMIQGDLVFFAHNTSNPSTIHHVGIYIGRGRMVEAPYTGGRVRISSIWRNGLIGAVRPAG